LPAWRGGRESFATDSEKLQECDNVGLVLCGEAPETELSASKPEKRVIVLHHVFERLGRVVVKIGCRIPDAPQPSDPPIGQTVLFPFTLRVPYTMPPFSAVVPTPDTTGRFDLMGFPAGEDSVRKIKDIKPAADIMVR